MDEDLQLAIQENYFININERAGLNNSTNTPHILNDNFNIKRKRLGLSAREADPELQRVILESMMEEKKQYEERINYKINQVPVTHKMKKPENEDVRCIICFEKKSDTIFAPCLHKDFCYECAEKIFQSNNAKCPLCKTKLIEYHKL